MTTQSSSQCSVVVTGDVIVDSYIDGHVSRISPEAPIPVLSVHNEYSHLGGAANVASSVANLVGSSHLITPSGDDSFSSLVSAGNPLIHHHVLDGRGLYSRKTRVVSNNHQFIRLDEDKFHNIDFELYRKCLLQLPRFSVLLISDYGKGIASNIPDLISFSRRYGCISAVDPKQPDWSVYRGANYIKCNSLEYVLHCNSIGCEPDYTASSLSTIRKDSGLDGIIVTCGSKGIYYLDANDVLTFSRSLEIPVFDVCGAGDSVFAGLGLLLASGRSLHQNLTFLNHLGAYAVQQFGTRPIPQSFLDECPLA